MVTESDSIVRTNFIRFFPGEFNLQTYCVGSFFKVCTSKNKLKILYSITHKIYSEAVTKYNVKAPLLKHNTLLSVSYNSLQQCIKLEPHCCYYVARSDVSWEIN